MASLVLLYWLNIPNIYTIDIIHITLRLKQRLFLRVKMQDKIISHVPRSLQNIDALQQHSLPSPLPLLLTSGKVEMLLFSKFSSSSSLHFAKDLGIADSLLYLRPRRLRLDRFPTGRKQVLIYCENHRKRCDFWFFCCLSLYTSKFQMVKWSYHPKTGDTQNPVLSNAEVNHAEVYCAH